MITLLMSLVLTVDPAARGLEIARAADAADANWKAEVAVAQMTVETTTGTEFRTFRMTTLEVEPERSLVELLEPARQRGTKVLTLSKSEGADEVFIHFPRHGRTRRIIGRKRTGRFMGSELTFEDLGSRKHHRYTHRFLKTETFADVPCHVVETVPHDTDSGYSRIVLWRQVSDYRLHKVEWYDKAGNVLVKTGVFSQWKPIDRLVRPMKYRVTNARTKKATTLTFLSRKLGQNIEPSQLSPAGLSR
ncbi:MAG: hypothetical protein ACI9OJ_003354 [Myxococcota bacterium]|jgi:hypothetical protein